MAARDKIKNKIIYTSISILLNIEEVLFFELPQNTLETWVHQVLPALGRSS